MALPPSNSRWYGSSQLESGNQVSKTSGWMDLSEDICNVVRGENRVKLYNIATDMLANKVTINFNMFGVLMKMNIACDLDYTIAAQ